MNRFKPGDRVRRTHDTPNSFYPMPVGSIWYVDEVSASGKDIRVYSDTTKAWRSADWFELGNEPLRPFSAAGADDAGWWAVDLDAVYPGTVMAFDLDALGLEVRVQVRRRP